MVKSTMTEFQATTLLAQSNSPNPYANGMLFGLFIGIGCCGIALLLVIFVPKLWRSKRIAVQLKDHLRADPYRLPVVSKAASILDLPGLHGAISSLGQKNGGQVVLLGFEGNIGYLATLSNALNTNRWQGIHATPVTYDTFELGPGESVRFPKNGVYLFHFEGEPYAVQVFPQQVQVAVMARDADLAEHLHRSLAAELRVSTLYRGRILSLEGSDEAGMRTPGWSHVKFHHFPEVRREDIILPEATLDLIERNTVRFFRHSDALKRGGYSVKRGLLFHGPPGTGKTHTLRWLRSSLPGVTVMLVTGEQQMHVKECVQLAKWLAPSLVLIEDVDLIAQSRQHSTHNPILHQLMNEMDGLSAEEQVIFILTTNRPEDLETALANRPGRIDQAVSFGMPDAEARRRLIQLYSRQVAIEIDDYSTILSKTEGATPAFLKELVRKAALVAIERAPHENITLTEDCLMIALNELTSGDGSLSRRLLGFQER